MSDPSENSHETARPATSIESRPSLNRGEAPIKKEYRIDQTPIVESSSAAALNSAAPYSTADDDAEGATTSDPRDRYRHPDRDDESSPGDRKRRKLDKKDKARGQNKSRHIPIMRENTVRICREWDTTGTCSRDPCKFAHSWDGYFQVKPGDIHFEPTSQLYGQVEYVRPQKERMPGSSETDTDDLVGRSLDLNTTCPVYLDLGYCPFGWKCRFLGGHVRRIEGEVNGESQAGPSRIGQWELTGRGEEQDGAKGKWRRGEINWPDYDTVSDLRNGFYEYPFSEKYLQHVEPHKTFSMSKTGRRKPTKSKNLPANTDSSHGSKANGVSEEVSEEAAMNAMTDPNGNSEEAAMNATETNGSGAEKPGQIDGQAESMDVPLRPEEKRRLPFEGGLYLAPLTTVGNLPFRRLCVDYGATITCSEMALAQPLVTGHAEEWALVRRHESEKTFGVQVAGGYANRMVPVAEMIAREIGGGIDFVDVNLGCPIDLVFNQGAGSALLDSPGRLGKILVGMNRALGEIPLTVKFRTGVASNKPNAHKLVSRFATEWGASAMTLHGRSRQQRYSKLADWAYIRECAESLREVTSDAGLPRVPMFGNGDCFSAQSYYEEKEKSGVDGVMIARGALIKPWIFTEVKERREWDISATERLEGIRKFAEYGLSHWGSDTQGVSKTRRFLCEALSFQHRYIPLGLLERLPAQMNERPPAYKGRNELETLLSSPFSGDWVKISEMFLGKVEDEWKFTPKHKSNAYGGEEAQG